MCLLAQATQQSSNLDSLICFLIKESGVEHFSSLFVPPVISNSIGLRDKIDLAAQTLKDYRPPLSVLCQMSGDSKAKIICKSNVVGFVSTLNVMIKTYGINAHKTYINYDESSSTFSVMNLDHQILYSVKVLF